MTGLAEINEISQARKRVAHSDAFDRVSVRAVPLPVVVPIRPEASENLIERSRAFVQRHVLLLSRLSLATVFFWFGILKVANVSPVTGLLRASIPFIANAPYIELLGIAEIAIGVGLLVNSLQKAATILMILHLLGTFSLLSFAPHLIFAPAFPVLTMEGEFVLKNVVLIASALVIACHSSATR